MKKEHIRIKKVYMWMRKAHCEDSFGKSINQEKDYNKIKVHL